MYIPKSPPSYHDKIIFQEKGGKFNTPYIITKISGDSKRMTFFLKEKAGKGKLKLVVNNQNESYSYGNYIYCITENYSIPILLVDKLENDKGIFVGKNYPTNSSGIAQFKISDIVLQSINENIEYPIPCFEITNTETNEKFFVNMSEKSRLESLGKVFTNDKAKATYKVVGLKKKKSDIYPYDIINHYVVKNSITSDIIDVSEKNAATECFKRDLSGSYIATLSKVEKPKNPTIRYGETKTIEDDGITKFSYIDGYIDVLIFAISTQFNFILKNVSDNSIKVIWNEAVFVDSDGGTSKIMHIGTKYSQKEGDQPATTIIKGAKIDDQACPTKNVKYNDVLKEWVTDPLFPAKPNLTVSPIRLMLPIQVKEVINEYIFIFDVEWVYNHPKLLNL